LAALVHRVCLQTVPLLLPYSSFHWNQATQRFTCSNSAQANAHTCQPATGSLCRSRSNNSSLPSFCEYSRFRILNHVLCWLHLDKSEGVVKTEISWAVREHRFFAREG